MAGDEGLRADDSRREDGRERRRRAQGRLSELLETRMEQIDPSVSQWSDEFVFGQVWAGEALSWEERVMVAIVALASQGHHTQLRLYLHGALQEGIPEAKIRQALAQLTVYAGFPVAIQALDVLREVLASEARHTT